MERTKGFRAVQWFLCGRERENRKGDQDLSREEMVEGGRERKASQRREESSFSSNFNFVWEIQAIGHNFLFVWVFVLKALFSGLS